MFLFHFAFKAGKLSAEDRQSKLEPLLGGGWSMVKDRDAIYKEFLFKDFNEVCSKKKCL